ncbi:Enterobactin outer-membrane receptor [Cesiribacter andamanensis AMV16]|uniref:Enterobactin outer-membrane receptor n=2 Tax=Cesiribacter TaxID=1133570 RepID=M7N9E4_9BACT|nr:Enterobactin outer-membrane receptor [Cesiribacter andamanensis AMV16]
MGLLLFSLPAFAQFTVSGTVRDQAGGDPLPGAAVRLKGTTQGVVTDLDGNFSIEVPGSQGVLVISFLGYVNEEVSVNATTRPLTITLKEDIGRLEEVVVTGLATTVKRSNLANAVSTVSSQELVGNTTPQTIDNALYGKIAGVNMNANGGAPGGGINVQLRGISTLGAGSSQPLYIVDGVYIDNSSIRNGRTQASGAAAGQAASNQDDAANRIADLNPDDIERIEVLKGPSAAAIYGTRANAGVIIITTKKGKQGKTQVRLNQDIGFAKAQNLVGFDPWNEDKIRTYYGEGERGQLELERYREAQNTGRISDWEEVFYGETAMLYNTQLSLSGGGEKTQFFVSAGIQNEDGIIKNTGFERYSIRANVNHELSKLFNLNLNTNYVRSDTDRGFTGNQNNTGGSIGYSIAYTPSYAQLFPDEQGNYPNNPYFNDNPLAIRDLATNNQKVDRFITSASLDGNLIQTSRSLLKYTINGGVDYLSSNSLVHMPEFLQHQQASSEPAGDVLWGRQDNINTNLQGFLIYNTSVGGFDLTSQAGVVRLDQHADFLLQRGRGLVGGQKNLQWAQVSSSIDQTETRITDFGWVLQQEANWEDKIIGTLGIRWDRSTLNMNQNEYYPFPRASVAVNLNNFDFWQGASQYANAFKVRAAYGQTGGLPVYGSTFESLSPQIIGGETGGQVGTRGVDPNLVPETASELELGIDAGFLDNRITLEATYYNKKVYDLILDLQPAEASGILAIATNAADLENKGWELGLGVMPVRTSNLVWSTQTLFWNNQSKITKMNIPTRTVGGFGPSLGSYLLAEGYSPTTIIGTPAASDVPGGYTIYGDRQPDFNLTFLNNFSIGNSLEFNFLIHWKKGGENINLSSLLWDDGGQTPGWSGDTDNNDTPDGLDRLLDWAVNGNTGVFVQKADYVKLREIGLYYTLPKTLTSGVGGGFINKVKLGVSGNNFLLWTPYESYDPETSNFGSQPIASNIEVTPYPSSRRYFFHLNVEF